MLTSAAGSLVEVPELEIARKAGIPGALGESVRHSIQTETTEYRVGGMLRSFGGYGLYANSLPPVWDERRQAVLYALHSHPQNNLWRGALARTAHKIGGTSAAITGKRRVKWFQDLIMFDADKGAGLSTFVEKVVTDYSWSDDGAYVEIIGRGDPSRPLSKDAITGLAVLDPRRCWPTGNREFPVWYQDAVSNKLHKLHWTRVHRFIDQESSDPMLRRRGFSALSRASGFIQQQISQMVYVGEGLDNNPPPGFVVVNGMHQRDYDAAIEAYLTSLRENGTTGKKPNVELVNPDASRKLEIEFVRFATAPEGFDPIQMTELQARGIALGLDIDPQDVLPLQGGSFGTNTQAKILDRKNRDGGYTHLLKMFERFLNTRVLPDSLRFTWEYRDAEQAAEVADNATKYIAIARDFISMAKEAGANTQKIGDIAFRFLAKNVDSIGEELTDPDGRVISLFDDDPEENEDNVTVDDDNVQPLQLSAGQSDDVATVEVEKGTLTRRKDYNRVERDFKDALAGVFFALNTANVDNFMRRRLDAAARGALVRYGREMVIEGKETGGVAEVEFDEAENNAFLNWLSQANAYMKNTLSRIREKGMTDAQVWASVDSYAVKTLQGAYYIGLESADRNSMMEFVGFDGDESCRTCRVLKGQRHRMRHWSAAGLVPRDENSANFECGLFHCQHYLEKTTGRASGSLRAAKAAIQKGHSHVHTH